MNCVGTYEVASAAYCWSWAAAAIVVSAAYYLLPGSGLHALLSVDDALYVADHQ